MIKILGSIKDVSEAKVISKYDFDIIDIKNNKGFNEKKNIFENIVFS